MNICGCLVHAMPEQVRDVAESLATVDGVEVHAQAEDGRIVIVVEDTAEERASDIIMSIHQIPSVVSLTLTYHHFEDPQVGQSDQTRAAAQETSETGAQP